MLEVQWREIPACKMYNGERFINRCTMERDSCRQDVQWRQIPTF